MNKLIKLLSCFWRAIVDMVNHDGVEHAGYMAFMSMLSLFPFLVFLTAIAGFIGQSDIGREFVSLILSHLPKDIVTSLQPRIQEITEGPPQGLLTIAILGAIWTASSSVEGLRTILNRVYRVSTPPAYILRRLLSIAQFLILTAILTIAMLGFVFFPLVWGKLAENFPAIAELSKIVNEPLWVYVRVSVIGFILFAVVAILYYVLPNAKISFLSVTPGAALVVILWLISGYGLSLYITHFQQVNVIYGSLGGIIISLLFFYIINMLFIYGAEFNYLLKQNFGGRRNR